MSKFKNIRRKNRREKEKGARRTEKEGNEGKREETKEKIGGGVNPCVCPLSTEKGNIRGERRYLCLMLID